MRQALDGSLLESLLEKQKIATLEDLKNALGTSSTMTVFRKLKPLGYQTSYSHRGKYYTLLRTPHFDEQGLWEYDGVWFSRYGNLLATSQRFVETSEAGVTAVELAGVLGVEVKEPLLALYRTQRIGREEIENLYVYVSAHPGQRRHQLLRRAEPQAAWEIGEATREETLSPELRAAIVLFYSLLDEQQRRLYAGLESIRVGRGGDTLIGDFLGLDPHTVARGRQQLLDRNVVTDGTRHSGGGRKPTEKKRPK